jgi:hypothetical protein
MIEFAKILKANPYHDERGRFSSEDKAKFVSIGGVFSSPNRYTGKPEFSDTHVTVFHGTASKALKLIMREGLQPAKEGGGDSWAEAKGWKQNFKMGDRGVSVYFAKREKHCVEYANRAKSASKAKDAVIVQFRIPNEVFDASVFDEADPVGYRFKGSLKPEWVVGHKVIKGEYHTVFACVLVDAMSGKASNRDPAVTKLDYQL